MEMVDIDRSIMFEASNYSRIITNMVVIVELNDSFDNNYRNVPKIVLSDKLNCLKDELKPIFDKYFGEGEMMNESFPFELHIKRYVDVDFDETIQDKEVKVPIVGECPHCSSIWSPGSEEFDLQQCFSCGKLASEPNE